MADFNLKYPDIPQVIYNGVRQKGVYNGSGQLVWPYDEEAYVENPFPKGVSLIPYTNDNELLENSESDDLVVFLAKDENGYYLISFGGGSTYPTFDTDAIIYSVDGEINISLGENTTLYEYFSNSLFQLERDGNYFRFLAIEGETVTDRVLSIIGKTNNGVRIQTSTTNCDFEISSSVGLYPYLFSIIDLGRSLSINASLSRLCSYKTGSSQITDSDYGLYLAKVVVNDGEGEVKPRTRKYAITLNTNGEGTVVTTLNSGWEWTTYGQLLNPPTPTSSGGLQFLDWAYDTWGTNIWNKKDVFSEDTTLYAIWKDPTNAVNNIAHFQSLNPSYYTGETISFKNPYNVFMCGRSLNNYYVVGDETGYQLIYDRNFRWHGPYSTFDYLKGNIRLYHDTIDLYNVDYEASGDSRNFEIYYPEAYSLFGSDDGPSVQDIMSGNVCCQPIRLIIYPNNQEDFQCFISGNYLYITLPDGFISVVSMNNDEIENLVQEDPMTREELWLDGFIIYWEANGQNERYRTMLVNKVTLMSNGGPTIIDFLYGDY